MFKPTQSWQLFGALIRSLFKKRIYKAASDLAVFFLMIHYNETKEEAEESSCICSQICSLDTDVEGPLESPQKTGN